MLKVFVDSGASIKQDEKEKYDVEIFPLKILLNDKEYLDTIDLSMEEFYHELIDNKQFPMTSLPCLTEIEEKVSKEDKAETEALEEKVGGSDE
jgi:fatty acid-binding protein DegV